MQDKPVQNKQTPKVSIGMPVYNGENYIREALDSLIAQSFSDFELLLSDNASTDETQSICKEYESRDNRIRYIRHDKNMGGPWNFEFVLQEAKGEYFMWSAHDDLCKTNYIQELIDCFCQDESLILCASGTEQIDSNGNLIKVNHLKTLYIDNNDWLKTRKLFFKYPTSNIFISIYGLYKRETLKKCKVFSSSWKNYLTNSEVPFLARLSLTGRIGAIPKALKVYRTHDESCYEKEIQKISFWDIQFLRLSILKQLFEIVFKTKLPLKEKVALFSTVFYCSIRICLLSIPKQVLKYIFSRRFRS